MKRFLRNLPIGQKLTLITTAISGAALLLACVAFAIYEQAAFRRTMARDFAILADIFDDNVASGLEFSDTTSIEQTLKTLGAHQRIVAAAVYDRQGRIVAQYRRSDAGGGFRFPVTELTGQRFTGERLDTFRDIVLAGERIGFVYIGADLSELRERAWLYAGIVGALLVACSLVALLLTARLQRLVSGPIVNLAHTVATIATEKNYAVRARKQGEDELGRLIDGFNEMLAQIQARDAALQQAHDTLEENVGERTRELQQEVSERRRSEEALRESHQRFEIVTRATTDVIWDWRLESDTVWFNENYQSLFGYGPEHVPTSAGAWLASIHPEDVAGVQQSLAAVLAGNGQVWSAEYRYRKHDGSHAIVHDRGWVLRDSQGQPWRMIGAMQDISERKRAQEESVRERARFKFIFDSVPVGICLDHVLPDGKRNRLLNTAHVTICGLKREDLVDGLFQRITHPDDRPRQEVLRQQLDAGLIGKYSLEKRYLKPDGQVVWVVFTMQRQHLADGSHQDLSTVADITPLKLAQAEAAQEQARFKFIFEAVPVGISLVALDAARTHLVNPAHERITGVSKADSNVPGVFMRASHPDDYHRQMEAVQPFIRGDVDHYTIEKRYVHPDGRHVWTVLTSRKFTDPASGLQQSVTTLVDITERKESEAKLASSLSLLNATLESTADGILVVDPQGRMTTSNRKFAAMWHLPQEILATGSDEKAVAFVKAQLKDPDEFTRKVRELHTRPEAETFDLLEFKDGRVFERYSQVQRVEGAAVGRVFCFRDITERKRAEIRLAEASGLLQAMLENTPDFIYFKDRASRFVRASKATAQRFNQAGEDALRGKTDFDFFPEEEARRSYVDEQEILRTGVPVVGKLEEETFPDGKVGWALTTKLPWRDSTGAIVGTFGISKDITALKMIESRLAYERDQLRSLLESSPDTIYFKDRESRFVRVSRSKVQKTLARLPQLKDRRQPDGQKMAEEDLLKGLTDFDTYDDGDARRAFEDEQQIIRTGVPLADKLEKQAYLDGSVRWSLTNKMPWLDHDGRIIGTFGISKDITPLKEAEEQLAQMHRQLLEVSRQAGMAEVATGVLHNVGNVLNSVNVSATLVIEQIRESKASNLPKLCAMLQEHAGDLGYFLTRDPKGSRIPSYLITLAGQITAERQAVVEELGQLRKNVDHIKDIVAMQQSYAKVSGVSETVRVSELVEDALRMNASALSRHGLDVVRDYAPDDPPVTVERHKVLQVLVNLIRNAKHACDDSGRSDKHLIVRIVRDEARIRISVLDNGVGIPPENLTRIFAHGFTTKKDGHGFGLHSGALVANELGGSLTAHSDGPGLGAVFTLELPLNKEAHA